MNPLILHLKYKYYDMILSGEKTTEYRECKPYWIKRLEGKKEIIFVPGYNLDNSLNKKATITNVHFVSFEQLPKYAQNEFKDSKHKYFIAIYFEIKR